MPVEDHVAVWVVVRADVRAPKTVWNLDGLDDEAPHHPDRHTLAELFRREPRTAIVLMPRETLLDPWIPSIETADWKP